MTNYNLTSTPLISTPGVLAWAMNGYSFKSDRARLERIFIEGYGLPRPAVRALLSGSVPHELTDQESVRFTYPVPRLTQAGVKAELRALDVTFRKTDFEEFRINLAGASESVAAYETDLKAALDTGRAMAAVRDAGPIPYKPAYKPMGAFRAAAIAELDSYRGRAS